MDGIGAVATLQAYNGAVADLQGLCGILTSARGKAFRIDLEFGQTLTKRVAVDAEQLGGAKLVAMRSGERMMEDRSLQLGQRAVIQLALRKLRCLLYTSPSPRD